LGYLFPEQGRSKVVRKDSNNLPNGMASRPTRRFLQQCYKNSKSLKYVSIIITSHSMTEVRQTRNVCVWHLYQTPGNVGLISV